MCFTAVWDRITALLIHGSFEVGEAGNSVCYWTGTPTLGGAQFREFKKLKSFEKLLKHPTSKDNVGDLYHRLLVMVSVQRR